jgi:hypothetical protein
MMGAMGAMGAMVPDSGSKAFTSKDIDFDF